MKKTLEDELMSLAHRILRLRGREDIEQMKELTGALYEKLSVLSFAEKHFSGVQPTIGLQDVAKAISQKKSAEPEGKSTVEQETSSAESISAEQKPEEVPEREIKPEVDTEKEKEISTPSKNNISSSKPVSKESIKVSNKNIAQPSDKAEDSSDDEIDLREISVHFDDLPQFEPVSLKKTQPQPEEKKFPESSDPESKEKREFKKRSNQAPSLEDLFPTSPKIKNRNESTSPRKSLNQRLNVGLSFGLNDRLAFINNLFDGNAEDFNRVISQLNSFEHYSEAHDFIKEDRKSVV